MTRLLGIVMRLAGILRRRKRERELEEELSTHLEMATAENLRRGMSLGEAERMARISLGGVEQVREAWRDQARLGWLENVARDVGYGLRLMRRTPGLTLVAVFTLALGIGANAAIFSVLESALLRPLPYPHAERLVMFGMLVPSFDSRPALFSASYVQLEQSQTAFESMASWRPGIRGCDLTESRPMRLACAYAESTFLPTFGVRPILGRNFTAAEDRPNVPKVGLISYGFWQDRFGGDPGIAGRVILLDGEPVTIVGVLPGNFEWPTLARVDILLPEALTGAERTKPLAGVVRAYGLLRPGMTMAEARAELEPALERWRAAAPLMFRKEMRLGIITVREDQVGSVRRALWVLLGAALALLVLASANVTNLLLARGAARERERAVRAALGAGRWWLARQQLIESGLLGLAGGMVGGGLACILLRTFVAIAPAGIPRIEQAGMGTPVILFVVGLSLITGLLAGLAPALGATSARSLTAGRAAGPRRGKLATALVALQVAVSLVLVTGAGLFLDTLWNLENIPLGMKPSQVVVADITLGRRDYGQPGAASQFFDRLESGLKGLPGITGVAVSDSLPPAGGSRAHSFDSIRVAGRPPFERGTGGLLGWRIVTPGYFRMLGIPILAGRGFLPSDRDRQSHSIVLNKLLAGRLFPRENPVGGHVQLDPPSGPWYAVVGIVGDVTYVTGAGRVQPAAPGYYVAREQNAASGSGRAAASESDDHAFFLVQSPFATQAVERLVRGEIASLDPTLPVAITTLAARVDQPLVQPRFNAALISLFAGLGLVLAALGLYGVLSFLVAGRTREIGLRMALGAMPGNVMRTTMARGLRPVLAGLAGGVALALGSARLLRGLLFGVSAADPRILSAAVLFILLAALAAAILPALRSTRVDPATALRHE